MNHVHKNAKRERERVSKKLQKDLLYNKSKKSTNGRDVPKKKLTGSMVYILQVYLRFIKSSKIRIRQ